MEKKIVIKGARENNLKNIDVSLPKDSLIVFSGLSGSGKSTLAFDTIFAEGQRRYMESLSSYARQFLGNFDKPDVDAIEATMIHRIFLSSVQTEFLETRKFLKQQILSDRKSVV